MSSQSKWKLVAVLIVASALLGAVGWQQFAPRPMSPTTITVTPTATIVTGSQTIVTPQRQTEWIRIGEVKPLNYYLSLLLSNGTSPYGQLYWELRKLPDLTNATAVAKIAYLALNATNPEVKEAFELMIKGGTPDPRDFKYPVPDYNTELQVLYWIACQTEFKKDDTLALAIALVNGFWVTVGDEHVSGLVMKDVSDLLIFFRETNNLQLEKGYMPLESYPLEALICLAWTGNMSPNMGPHPIVWGMRYTSGLMKGYVAEGLKVGVKGYEWNTVSVQTLKEMREIADKKVWISKDTGTTVDNLEEYFYFDNGRFTMKFKNWVWGHPEPGEETYVEVNGQTVPDYIILNVDFYFEHFKKTGKGIGTCNDEASWIDAWCKSWGIATNLVWRGGPAGDGNRIQHWHIIYYDPDSRTWKACEYQLSLEINLSARAGTIPIYLTVFRPPVRQDIYFKKPQEQGGPVFGLLSNNDRIFYHYQRMLTLLEIREMFVNGLPSSIVKEWLLYLFPSAIDARS